MSQNDELGSGKAQEGAPAADGDMGNYKVKAGAGTAMIVVVIIGLLAIVGGLVWFCGFREDPTEAHVRFQTEILGPAQSKHYEGFWKCALDAPYVTFKKNTELISRIHENGANPAQFGKRLLEDAECLPSLNAGIGAFQKIKTDPATPPEYGKMLDDVVEQMKGVQKAWTEFAQYELGGAERAATVQSIAKSGQAWMGYQEAAIASAPEKAAEWAPGAVPYVGFMSCILGDTPYTSFSGEEGMLAQDKVAAAIDLQCDNNPGAFLDRIEQCKGTHLKESMPRDEAFEAASKQWTSQQGDFTSLETIGLCIDRVSKERLGSLVENIAKAWEGYNASYKKLMDYSRSKSGGYIATTPR